MSLFFLKSDKAGLKGIGIYWDWVDWGVADLKLQVLFLGLIIELR